MSHKVQLLNCAIATKVENGNVDYYQKEILVEK
jgi:hypothetical protein